MPRYLTIVFRLADNAESQLVLGETERIHGAKVSAISHGHLMDERDALENKIHEMLPELRFASEIMDSILSERGHDFALCLMAKNFKLRSAPFLED